MRGNTVTIEVSLKRGKMAKSVPLYQYDYGQKLIFTNVELPSVYEVHFSNELHGESVTMIGDSTGVLIPDSLLTTGLPVYLWAFLHTDTDDGETEYTGVIPVIQRAQPSNVTPTPEEQSVITQAIAALNAGVETVEDAVANIDDTIQTSLQEAKESGIFDGADGQDGQDGQDGFTPTVDITSISGGYQMTITNSTGASVVNVMNGVDGSPGADGSDGADGQDGADGADGEDGFSPVATVTKDGATATISITDRTGTTTTTISDGEKGDTGETGATPSFSIGTVTTGDPGTDADVTMSGTQEEPVLNFLIPQGADGDATVDDTAGAGDTTHVWSANKTNKEISDLKSAIKHLPSNIDTENANPVLNETDPTVPAWAKSSSKPEYSAAEIDSTDGNVQTDINGLKTNVNGKIGKTDNLSSYLDLMEGNVKLEGDITEPVEQAIRDSTEIAESVVKNTETQDGRFIVAGVDPNIPIITPEMFGAVGDGETDDSAAINAAVAAGDYILFRAKTYLIANSIEITHGDVTLDFNGASILCTANNFIEASSEFDVTVYSGAYTAGSRNGYGTGTGLTLITSNEMAQLGRRYYMCGTTCYSDNGELNLSLPYAISACEMKKQSAPLKNITIKNIGSYSNDNDDEWDSYTITFSGIADAMIEHCNLGPGNYNYVGISITRCSNITIRDCVIGTFNNVCSNTYGIQVSACSFTTVDTCRMYSTKWHCITTGSPETAMYTYVLNSVLSLATNASTPSAYSDHGNALGTKLQNCKITGYVTIADGVVDHCEMHSHKSGFPPQIIMFAWVGNKVKPNFTVSNIRANGGLIITFSSDNQEPQGSVSLNIDRVHVSNIMCDGENTMIQFPEMSVNSSIASMNYGVIDVDGYAGRFDRMQVFKTVRVSHGSIASVSYRATAGYDAFVSHNPKLIMSDCSVGSFTNSAHEIELQATNCSFSTINYGTEVPNIIELLNCYISDTSNVTLKAATLFLLANCVFNCSVLALAAQTGKVSGTNMTTLAANASGFQSDIYKEANAASYAQKTAPNGAWTTVNI